MSGQLLKLVYLTGCSSLIFESRLTNLLSTVNCPVSSSSLYHRKASLISVFSSPTPDDQVINLVFLKSDGISDQTLVVPGVQHSFSGVVGHHGVVVVLIGELNVGVPLFSSLGVVCKVDGRFPSIGVNTVDHPTGHKCISHRAHSFCKITLNGNSE